MSDLEKVVTYAKKLGSKTPIQLRWEGAGDATHAAVLLRALQGEIYNRREGSIAYNAVICCYEPETSAIFKRAKAALEVAHQGCWDTQTWVLYGGMDLKRASHEKDLPKAHIMFVRNIMPTSGTNSETTESAKLLDIHQTGLRNRSNSLSGEGHLRLGMSGAPGLTQGDTSRSHETHAKLFDNAKALSETNTKLALLSDLNRTTGEDDYDTSVDVMKNDGSALKTEGGETKRTFYMTFVRREYELNEV